MKYNYNEVKMYANGAILDRLSVVVDELKQYIKLYPDDEGAISEAIEIVEEQQRRIREE